MILVASGLAPLLAVFSPPIAPAAILNVGPEQIILLAGGGDLTVRAIRFPVSRTSIAMVSMTSSLAKVAAASTARYESTGTAEVQLHPISRTSVMYSPRVPTWLSRPVDAWARFR